MLKVILLRMMALRRTLVFLHAEQRFGLKLGVERRSDNRELFAKYVGVPGMGPCAAQRPLDVVLLALRCAIVGAV
jgi:hypothetical protein